MSLEYALVHDRVHIGSVDAVSDHEFITGYNIGAIVKCETDTDIVHATIPTRIISNLDDEYLTEWQQAALMQQLHFTADFIHEFLTTNADKSVLVHCYAGQNRSALMIGFYLMKHRSFTYQMAFDALKAANAKRELDALWNGSFRELLRNYEKVSKGVTKSQ